MTAGPRPRLRLLGDLVSSSAFGFIGTTLLATAWALAISMGAHAAGGRTPATAAKASEGANSRPADPAASAERRPTLSGHTLHGEPVDLSRLRGQVVLVFLWSTDCPVCVQRLPELRRNLQGWRGRPFTVVAVNQDRQPGTLRDYEAVLDRLAPPSPQMRIVWRGDAAHHDDLGDASPHTPTWWLLDRDGVVVKRMTGVWGAEVWDEIAEMVEQ